MAERKKLTYMRLYYEFEQQTKQLSDAQVGRLVRAMLAYAIRKEVPTFEDDPFLNMAFQYERPKIDAAIESFEELCEVRSNTGKLGGRPKKNKNITVNEESSADEFES